MSPATAPPPHTRDSDAEGAADVYETDDPGSWDDPRRR